MSYAWRTGAQRQTKQSAFHGKPPASARKVANNTFSYTAEDGANVIRLHFTDVVKTMPDGRVVLNSGGWRSPTTKDRMNAHARGYMVITGKGGWRVCRLREFGKSVAFYDGMVLPDAIDKPSADDESAQREEADRKLKREIRDFAKLYERGVPLPNAGDCWLCMSGNDDPEHLREHIREGYAHGTLAVNAMKWAGLSPSSIGIHLHSNIGIDNVVRAVRRYLQHKLGLNY